MSNLDAKRAAWLRENNAVLFKHADVTNAVLHYETVSKRTQGGNPAWAQPMRDAAWAAIEKATRNVECVDDTGHHEPVAMSDDNCSPEKVPLNNLLLNGTMDSDADKLGESVRQRPNPEAPSRGSVGKSAAQRVADRVNALMRQYDYRIGKRHALQFFLDTDAQTRADVVAIARGLITQ